MGSGDTMGARSYYRVIFTAFAVSLGAHFWFDLLSRIVKLRAAGKPPTVKAKKGKEQ